MDAFVIRRPPPVASSSSQTVASDAVEGFDYEAGRTWIYPDNETVRGYQFTAVKRALFKNTLVVLPTGLGKTFIAAVVMYNFYRWFPTGRVIFMATTRPLVTQQIEACIKISGIPSSECIELTGHIHSSKRQKLWQTKRVIFATPQVIENDLESRILPAKSVRCLVVDEAHRAQGNASYVLVVRGLQERNRNGFRILALSATPGSDILKVQQILLNLYIADITLRVEESIDVMPFKNQRSHLTITVELQGDIKNYFDMFCKICEPTIRELLRAGFVYSSALEKVSKWQLIKAKQIMQEQGPPAGTTAKQVNFALYSAISMRHALELLVCHGIRPFYNCLNGHMNPEPGEKAGYNSLKGKLDKSIDCDLLLKQIRDRFGDPDALTIDPYGAEISKKIDLTIGHPKLVHVRDILLRHFQNNEGNTQTRAMVFSKYRDSVCDIMQILLRYAPNIKPMMFVGQQTAKGRAGTNQKEQLRIMREFKEGNYNTLVATCVAEEGLDIGEVDLIICYDASASPISFVQRRGRTGRKRDGEVFILMTQGYEDTKHKACQQKSKQLQKQICDKSSYVSFLYKDNPRMVPSNLEPVLLYQKMVADVKLEPEQPVNENGKEKRKSKRTKRPEPNDELECSFKKAKDYKPLDESTIEDEWDDPVKQTVIHIAAPEEDDIPVVIPTTASNATTITSNTNPNGNTKKDDDDFEWDDDW